MKTAVEWLVEQLKINNYISENAHWLIDDAIEMEKQQIKDAWLSAWIDSMLNPLEDKYYEPLAEEYYNEIFENK